MLGMFEFQVGGSLINFCFGLPDPLIGCGFRILDPLTGTFHLPSAFACSKRVTS